MKKAGIMLKMLICIAMITSLILPQKYVIYAEAAKNQGNATIAGKMSKKKAALRAYAKIVNRKKYNRRKNGEAEYRFSICDLNGDRIPEMILYEGDGTIWGIKAYYRYANGNAVKIKPAGFPTWGTMHEIPARKSFALFRGGPAVDGYMPYSLFEYKIIKNKIKLVHTASMYEYTNGKKECFYDEKPCGVKKYKKIANSMRREINPVANSRKNRIKYGVNGSAGK